MEGLMYGGGTDQVCESAGTHLNLMKTWSI